MVIADPEGEEIADYECEETLPDILEKLYIEKKYDTFTVIIIKKINFLLC